MPLHQIMKNLSTDQLAEILWDYLCLNQPIKKADCIIGMGSHDVRTAERAAELFLEGYGPVLLFSGGLGSLTLGRWKKPEAEVYAEVAIRMGVAKENILIENRSTNTGDNILFSQGVLRKHGLRPKSILAVHNPYMERRVWTTFKKLWPEVELFVTSPNLSRETFCNENFPKESILNIMVGDLERIKKYPALGFQIEQEIPGKVWAAFKELVRRGFDKRLIGKPVYLP